MATAEATADEVNAIAAASEEQSAASEEINRSILECNDMSSQIAEAMAEAGQGGVRPGAPSAGTDGADS